MLKEGQEVWVAFKDGSNKYKATVLATGEHFTCVHSWIGIPSMEKKEIVENERVFALDYNIPKTIRIGKYEVAEPLREAPAEATLCYITLTIPVNSCNYLFYTKGTLHEEYLQRGLLHLTKEAAELHTKALLAFTTTELTSETK